MTFARLQSVIVLVLIFTSRSGEATTLAVLGTPTHIVVASDSMAYDTLAPKRDRGRRHRRLLAEMLAPYVEMAAKAER